MMNERFFDREDYLTILSKRIGDLKQGYRQNLAIIGEEMVGKTSIVSKFLHKFCDTKLIILYFEARPETLSVFVRRFIGVLLYHFLINSSIPLKEDIDFLISKSQKYIPKTVEKINWILNAVNKRKKNDVLPHLFNLCELIYEETGKYCIVIFDEFQNLEKIGINNLYKEWSRILITQKNTLYIVISSLRYKATNILSQQLNLLFGNFELIEVGPFDIKTSENYINLKLSKINLNGGLKDFLVHFTGGLPFYLELITDSLLKYPKENLEDLLENMLFESSGILNQRFSNYIKRFLENKYSNDYISVLYLISSGRNKIKEISHIMRLQKKDLHLRINFLMESDVITRQGDFLKINDRVFAFWLRFVYREKLQSLTFDAKHQKLFFKKYIQELINDFLKNSKRTLKERMEELLRLFADETIHFERKRIKLNHFREIKAADFNCQNLRTGLIGRSNDSLWIMGLKNELITEEDIAEFAKECRKFKHKSQKKIIVSLRDIDSNARLRAMEEKILTWNITNLNEVLDLYYRPWIIA